MTLNAVAFYKEAEHGRYRCPTCNGRGWVVVGNGDDAFPDRCALCQGEGQVRTVPASWADWAQRAAKEASDDD